MMARATEAKQRALDAKDAAESAAMLVEMIENALVTAQRLGTQLWDPSPETTRRLMPWLQLATEATGWANEAAAKAGAASRESRSPAARAAAMKATEAADWSEIALARIKQLIE